MQATYLYIGWLPFQIVEVFTSTPHQYYAQYMPWLLKQSAGFAKESLPSTVVYK